MTSVGSWHCGNRISFFIRFVTFFGLKVLKYKSCKNIFERDYYSIFFRTNILYFQINIVYFYKFVTFF